MGSTAKVSALWPMLIALLTAKVIETAFADINYSIAITALLVLVVWLVYARDLCTWLFEWHTTNDGNFNSRLSNALDFLTMLFLLFFATMFLQLVSRGWNGATMDAHTLLVYIITTGAVVVALVCAILDVGRDVI
jgi:hypothetical protein